jgi:hypothetical protein
VYPYDASSVCCVFAKNFGLLTTQLVSISPSDNIVDQIIIFVLID